jgi:Flp pilus assembly CpaF family ATPase
MTENNRFKKLIRLRMSITGESYTSAQRNVRGADTKRKATLFENLLTGPAIKLVEERLSIHDTGMMLIGGQTGSGKTTLMSSILHHGMSSESLRAIVIERYPELVPTPDEFPFNCVKFTPNDEISEDDLIRQSLRMRPNLLFVGEMQTYLPNFWLSSAAGHSCFSTIHAKSEEQVINRATHFAESLKTESTQMPDHLSSLRSIAMTTRLMINHDGEQQLYFLNNVIPVTPEALQAHYDNEWEEYYEASEYELVSQRMERLGKTVLKDIEHKWW